ncbi:MAG: efflux RND transporter permease subunit [Candidatus Obscuribacterales bacterium]
MAANSNDSLLARLIRVCIDNKPLVVLGVAALVVWGVLVAPFDWDIPWLPRNPVPVDAIPDIGEVQQIVFTDWPGRSPQDVEDQVTYPLTTALLGVPKVKEIRASSLFGFSSINIIFEDDADFYWTRSRILEKLSSLPGGSLPEGVIPTLGPDATTLGQVFWYTLEGVGPDGQPTGGWDLHELRTIQDWQVRYFLLSAAGVSEVASVGGFVQEYQIDVNPAAARVHGVTLAEIVKAIKDSNIDVGARTIEVNQVEYIVRGIGFIKTLQDIESAVVKVENNVPIRIQDVATVSLGPALRRGALDKAGAEAVGGAVIARYGDNPLQVIKNVKEKIAELEFSLPTKVLPDGTVSQVKIIPFYDRTGLIYETLGTLNVTLILETLVTIIVILAIIGHLPSSLLISGSLPLVILMVFIAMKSFGVDANIVSLSGIAIAIGTIVTMGIIVCENVLRRVRLRPISEGGSFRGLVIDATSEVGSSVLTAIATTVISFLPVFGMVGEEGRLFRPLAFTKTFALIGALLVGLMAIPPLIVPLFRRRDLKLTGRVILALLFVLAGIGAFFLWPWWIGAVLIAIGGYYLVRAKLSPVVQQKITDFASWILALVVAVLLALYWLPLGPEKGGLRNSVFVIGLIGLFLLLLAGFSKVYPATLRWALRHKLLFLILPLLFAIWGALGWLGFYRLASWLPTSVLNSKPAQALERLFPGLGKEFMPPLDEGSFLFMPALMPHASIGEALAILQAQDAAIDRLPEVDLVVGKLGRIESAIDPAPISMFETVVNYKPRYLSDEKGRPPRFRYDPDEVDLFRDERGRPLNAPDGKPYYVQGTYLRDEKGQLIPDKDGVYFRQWRPPLNPDLNPGREPWGGIRNPNDIWEEIIAAASMPGATVPAKLQPIQTRIIMLQSGLRAPLGVVVLGPDLASLESAGLEIERLLREVPGVEPDTVIADRVIGKPYLEIEINREKIARYGLRIQDVQNVIETAIGGKFLTRTVEGLERYPVRMRYQRELRGDIESLGEILVTVSADEQIPLNDLATITYVRGPQIIKSEDGRLVTYVTFDKRPGWAEVDVAEEAQSHLKASLEAGETKLPTGVTYSFTGMFENQQRSAKTMSILLPASLLAILVILYLQFGSFILSTFVFSGIIVAWAGGFILLWLYGQSGFLDFSLFGTNMRELFQVHPVNLSVAIWVGFLALFGVATDNGVLVATTIVQRLKQACPSDREGVRAITFEASVCRLRPCVMASATTILALLPLLTSQGRGADLMIPMALPSFGGMLMALLSLFVVPVLFCFHGELKVSRSRRGTLHKPP